ncbi:hypothetical protein GCM10010519_67300 [Streptomyces lactacystinicus]
MDNFVHPHELLRPVRGDGKPMGPQRGKKGRRGEAGEEGKEGKAGRPTAGADGNAERPAVPAWKRGRRASPRSAGRPGPMARCRGQLAAGAGLDDDEEPELDDEDEAEEDVDVADDVEGVDDDPAPTVLLEDERLSVR